MPPAPAVSAMNAARTPIAVTRIPRLADVVSVLATGGGAFMDPETRAAVKAHGISIWLKANLRVLMKRVGRRDNRPLLQVDNPEAVMKKLMAERNPVYAQADITVESREAPHEVMVGTILDALSHLLDRKAAGATGASADTQ